MNDGMTLIIALVKLYNDFYVLLKPSYINLKQSEIEDAADYYETAANDLWGEGTCIKTFVITNVTDVNKAIDAFTEMISIYEDTCLLTDEESLIDYHEFAEEKMTLMGLPLIYAHEDDDPIEEVTFVTPVSDFCDRILSEINRKNIGKTRKEIVMNITKICCNKTTLKGRET